MNVRDFSHQVEGLLRQLRKSSTPVDSRDVIRLNDLRDALRYGQGAYISTSDRDFVRELLDRVVCSESPAAYSSGGDARRSPNSGTKTTAAELELEEAKQTIVRLQQAGKRAVAQRDQWEARAKVLEKQVAE